jgi:hypothetical protein
VAVTASEDASLAIWDIRRRGLRTWLKGHESAVRAVAVSPDGVRIASGGDDKTLRIWETSTAKLRDTIFAHGDSIRAVAFCPDGSLIATSGRDQTVKLWDSGDGGLRATYRGHAGSVDAVAFSPNGQFLAAAGESVLMHRRSDSHALVLRTFAVDGEEVGLAHTLDGVFEGDPRALRRVLYRVGDDVATSELLSAEQLSESFFHDGLGVAFSEGRPISVPMESEHGIGLPPSVEFVDPLPKQVASDTVEVSVQAKSRGGGIAAIRLYVNGELIKDSSAQSEDKRSVKGLSEIVVYRVPLVVGDNVLEAEAVNIQGRVKSPRVSVTILRKES